MYQILFGTQNETYFALCNQFYKLHLINLICLYKHVQVYFTLFPNKTSDQMHLVCTHLYSSTDEKVLFANKLTGGNYY